MGADARRGCCGGVVVIRRAASGGLTEELLGLAGLPAW